MKLPKYTRLLICIALPLTVGSLAGFATASNIGSWYAAFNKPNFNPPNYLFGPVWTLLYILMGVSLFRIWESEKTEGRRMSLVIFAIQLILNFAWSFLFFQYHKVGLALIEIILLWLCILLMIIFFRKVDKTSSYLQIPYLLWVSFATALNYAIWQLN